ncbi:DNA-binding protein [Methylocella silvestris]|uniref:DNA-binding protein n=1 Tax=Methylocella silvestris TaxID=199596 RepID=UPI0015E13B0B|nr:DNA-binding protein [Methylocella silvestris]
MESDEQYIWGAGAIAKALGLTRPQAFHMLSAGRLPARKIGKKWVSTKKALHEALTPIAAAPSPIDAIAEKSGR